MPLYSVQEQFVSMMLDGSKSHTVRRKRKRPTKVGDVLYFYSGLRTKKCKFVMQDTCKKIIPVVIYADIGQIHLDGRLLPLNEMMHFAVRDGFANYMDFFAFFRTRYSREVLEHEMEVIYWR